MKKNSMTTAIASGIGLLQAIHTYSVLTPLKSSMRHTHRRLNVSAIRFPVFFSNFIGITSLNAVHIKNLQEVSPAAFILLFLISGVPHCVPDYTRWKLQCQAKFSGFFQFISLLKLWVFFRKNSCKKFKMNNVAFFRYGHTDGDDRQVSLLVKLNKLAHVLHAILLIGTGNKFHNAHHSANSMNFEAKWRIYILQYHLIIMYKAFAKGWFT